MLGLGVALDKLWTNDVSDGISNEDSSSHDGLLCSPRNIAGAKCDDQADNRSEETSERVANNRNNGLVSPLRLPNHHTPGDDGETACDEHWDSRVGNDSGDEATQRDEDHTNSAHGELE